MIFRIIGELVIVFVLGGTAMHQLNKKYLKPWRSRRHIERLVTENAEMDKQLSKMIGDEPYQDLLKKRREHQ